MADSHGQWDDCFAELEEEVARDELAVPAVRLGHVCVALKIHRTSSGMFNVHAHDRAARQVDWNAELEGLGAESEVDDDGQASQGSVATLIGEDLAVAVGDGGAAAEDPLDMIAEYVPGIREVQQLALDTPDAELVESKYEAALHYTRDKVHIQSLASESTRLDVDRNILREERLLAAALVAELERQAWLGVERHIMEQRHKPGVVLKVHLECFMYDGVDLSVATRRSTDIRTDFAIPLEDDMDEEELVEHRQAIRDELDALAESKELGPAKLLNSQHGCSMLVAVDGKNIVLQSERVTWLQCFDRTTGETLKRALDDLSMASDDTRLAFKRTVRLAMTDAAGYNIRAERHSREPEVAKLHLLCDAHIVAGIHNKVYNLQDATVTGMIKTSQSLSGAGTISAFRSALRRVLGRDLRLVDREPSDSAKEYTRSMLDLFLGKDVKHAKVRAIVSRCASGDWRKRGVFEYMAVKGETRSQVLKVLYRQFVPALVGHTPRTFPRSRWTGAELALADYGMLSMIHGLLEAAYTEYMRESFAVPGADAMEEAVAGMDDDAAAAADIGGPRSAEAKRHYRAAAVKWIREPTRQRDLAVMAILLRPMSRYMIQEIASATALSLSESHVRRLEAMLAVGDMQTFLDSCRWPLLEAANGVKDLECMSAIADLHESEHFQHWLAAWHTRDTQTLLFKGLSRQAASVHELLHKKHQSCPYKVFLLATPAAEDVEKELLEDTCVHSRDEYTSSFMLAYANLRSEDALLELAMILLHARTNTVSLESSNATVRRRLFGASLQVIMPELHAVSSEFALGKLRRRQHSIRHPPGHKEHNKKLSKKALVPQQRKRRGAGGAGRAFMNSKKMRVSKELWDEFRALPEHEKQEYAALGRIATAKAKYMGAAFDTRTKVAILVALSHGSCTSEFRN